MATGLIAMCNRFNRSSPAEIEEFERRCAEAYEKVFGSAPATTYGWSKHQIPVVYQGARGRTLGSMRWGVWPDFEKQLPSRPVVNARDDALLTKSIWKHSARECRCLIAADGFMEWAGPAGAKWEVLFHLPDNRPFFFAGVWGRDPVGEDRGFALVTTRPNAVIEALPHDRMPVIFNEEEALSWIGDKPLPDAQLLGLCRPYPRELLRKDMPPPAKKPTTGKLKQITKTALTSGQAEMQLGD